MSGSGSALFDYAALDGIAFAAERGRLDTNELPLLKARDIGPLLELSQLAEAGRVPSPRQAGAWLVLDGLDGLSRALESGRVHWLSADGRLGGFMKAGAMPDEAAWTGFGVAAQQAATVAGFPRQVAAQLTGALGELYSNIHEHSGASATGLIAFRAQPGRFEFAAADRGVGILSSLQSCGAYTALNDHGEALRLALTDGVSRHGHDSGRGHGFRPLFIGLANLSGALRFRSGDHALLIDGRSPTLMTARAAQKPPISGFLVSVICEVATRRRPA